VYEVEPLPPEHPLWTAPNVIMTPHMAGYGPHLNERRYQHPARQRGGDAGRHGDAQRGGQGELVLAVSDITYAIVMPARPRTWPRGNGRGILGALGDAIGSRHA
jgi:hypothetical protein